MQAHHQILIAKWFLVDFEEVTFFKPPSAYTDDCIYSLENTCMHECISMLIDVHSIAAVLVDNCMDTKILTWPDKLSV